MLLVLGLIQNRININLSYFRSWLHIQFILWLRNFPPIHSLVDDSLRTHGWKQTVWLNRPICGFYVTAEDKVHKLLQSISKEQASLRHDMECDICRAALFNLGWYFSLQKFCHAFPISGWEALPGRGLLSLLHNGTCEAKNTNLH